MKSKLFLGAFFLVVGCNLFPSEEDRYLPFHDNAALLRNYSYLSHTSSSIIYETEVSGLAWDGGDVIFLEDEFNVEAAGTFQILDFEIEESPVSGNSSTVLLIDQSGSYLEIDPFNNRTKAMNKFLEDFLPPNDFLVGGFSKSGLLTSEPAEFSSDNFNSSWVNPEFLYELAGRTGGGCLLYDAIDDAIDKLSASPKTKRNLVVMIHAADAESSETIADVVTKANLNNVKIHVIIFGTVPDASDVWQLSEQTDGMLAVCATDSDVITVFDNLERLLNVSSSVNILTIQFTPTAGNVVSGNEYENLIRITETYSGLELNPVYVKVKIP